MAATARQMTGSIQKGRAAAWHNQRKGYLRDGKLPEHIDPERVADDVTLVDEPLEEVYQRLFGEARVAYNARQVERGHPERQVEDYLEKVKADKQLKTMYEFVVQVGNRDAHPDTDEATAMFREWLERMEERFGEHFAVKQAIVHNDEAVPHMHLEVVPVAESKRGMPLQNSLNKAISQSGCADWCDMLGEWDKALDAVMAAHGIERVAGNRETQRGGVDIKTYKKQMRAEERAVEAAREADEAKREADEAERRLEGLRRAEKAGKLNPVEATRVFRQGRKDEAGNIDLEREHERARERHEQARERHERALAENSAAQAELGRLRRAVKKVKRSLASVAKALRRFSGMMVRPPQVAASRRAFMAAKAAERQAYEAAVARTTAAREERGEHHGNNVGGFQHL